MEGGNAHKLSELTRPDADDESNIWGIFSNASQFQELVPRVRPEPKRGLKINNSPRNEIASEDILENIYQMIFFRNS